MLCPLFVYLVWVITPNCKLLKFKLQKSIKLGTHDRYGKVNTLMKLIRVSSDVWPLRYDQLIN